MPSLHEIATRKLLGRTNFLTGAIALLCGLLFKCLAILWTSQHPPQDGFLEHAVDEVGSFLIVTFLLAFFYELVIREDHQKLLKEELANEMSTHFSRSKTDYQDSVRRELDLALHSHLNAYVHDIYPEGRVDTLTKMAHIRGAKSEIVEIGTALRTFAGYFERTPDFGSLIEDRLKNGVNLICLMLDPEYAGELDQHAGAGMREPLQPKILETQQKLLAIKKEFDAKRYSGKMEIYCYRHLPCFAAIMVDCDVRSANVDLLPEEGRLFYSPYLYFENNASAPTIEIHCAESRVLFGKLRASAHKVFTHSKKLTTLSVRGASTATITPPTTTTTPPP